MVKKSFLIFLIFIVTLSTLTYIFLFEKSSDKPIVLGSSLPLSGINKELGSEIMEGANAYLSHINAKGGVKGRHIHLVSYDDKYEPQNTLKNTQTLIYKNNAFALLNFVGTPTTKKVLSLINEENIPFISPYTGASFLRNPSFTNVVNFRSSYKEEIETIVNYLNKYKKVTKFAIFYQNDDYGEEGYIATIEALNRRNLKLLSEGTYKRNTLSIRHALHEIKQTKPEAVIIIGSYKPSAQFIKKARECCFKDMIFAPISFVNGNSLMKELNGAGKNILFSQTVPSYDNKNLLVTKEYHRLLNFYYPKREATYGSFESFLVAKIVVKALLNVPGDLTQRKFLYSIKNLPKDVLDDIPIVYKNNQLLNKVYLSNYKHGKFVPVKEIE
ncbi:ABC transporter substrate-binding protein [Sulfurospirillum arcachonense]|uniref:ABC transporter substrate-binding protein n=1 Tax=Sulfurospirillum arcachonense TaxID=57666 RepID=UPI00046868C5|nr:ABC transporter substrate-binding protein [Sulfurospirillum arcachonense]